MGPLFISPMGEPFRAGDTPGSPLQRWFDGADANHDGRIVLAEFSADAARFFALLDTDHDGEIEPAEIEHYETVVAPEIASPFAGGGGGGGRRGGGGRPPGGGMGGGPGGGMGGGGMGGGGMGGGGMGGGGPGPMDEGSGGPPAMPGGMRQGAGRFSFLATPEPVVAADADFNRGVTLAEFTRAAGQRFALLDTAHQGYLTMATLPPLPGRGMRGRPPRPK